MIIKIIKKQQLFYQSKSNKNLLCNSGVPKEILSKGFINLS